MKEIEKLIQDHANDKPFAIQMPNGDRLSFERWGNEKNYSICINKAGTNMYEKVGQIRYKQFSYFREQMETWFGNNS